MNSEARNELYHESFEILKKIDEELLSKGKDTIEVMVAGRTDPKEILDFLVNNSAVFRYNFSNNSDVLVYILNYVQHLDDKFSNLQTNGIINFDSDIVKAKEPTSISRNDRERFLRNPRVERLTYDNNSGRYIVTYKKENVVMTPEEVDETIGLLNNAVGMFHSIYENKEITGTLHNGDKIYLELRANELLHILGITKKQVLANSELRRVLGITDNRISAYEILCRILYDFGSNKDIVQLYEDINKKKASSVQFKDTTRSELLPFHKIRGKTIAFINSGPIVHPKLIAPLAPGRRLTPRASSNIAMLSKTPLSQNYDWVYMGAVKEATRMYTETLVVDNSINQRGKFSEQVPAMLIAVQTGTGGGVGNNIFSHDQQYQLFLESLEAFGGDGGMNFDDLKQYFGYGKKL